MRLYTSYGRYIPHRVEKSCWLRLSPVDESTDSFQDENEHMRIVSLAAAAQTSMQPELLGTLTHLMPCCALP